MNDVPRQKLVEMVAKYGRSLSDDRQRCEGLLRDFCGEYKREVSALVGAVKERVPTDLMVSSGSEPREILWTRLSNRLEENAGLAEELAWWAVESWALALGLVSSGQSRPSVTSQPKLARQESAAWPHSIPRNRPGYGLPSRPLHLIWVVDCSASMALDGKIQALNNAIREAIPHLRGVADDNPGAEVFVQAIKFSSGAQWHIHDPTHIADLKWRDLSAGAPVRDMGQALSMVAEQLKIPPMSDRALPPVLVLISDGQPTDSFDAGLNALVDQPWGKKAVRIAIGIGDDANQAVLQKFIGNNELKPLQAYSPEDLVRHIRWVSCDVAKEATSEHSRPLSAPAELPERFRIWRRSGSWQLSHLLAQHRRPFVGTAIGVVIVLLSWFVWLRSSPNTFDYKHRESQILTDHSNTVTSVVFSPDGKSLASGGLDSKLILWDTQTGKLKLAFTQDSGDVNSISFSPDGKSLASGGSDKAVRLYDAQTGEMKRALVGHDYSVKAVAFSPDGRFLASGSADFRLMLWDAQTGVLKRTLRGHRDEVRSVAFSADGKTLASGGNDSSVRLWDVQTGQLRQTLMRHAGEVNSVAFSPDGKILGSGSADFNVILWDAQTGEFKRSLKHRDRVMSIVFLPDGNTLMSGGNDNTVRLWDVQTGELKQTLTGHGEGVNSVATSSDGRILASGSKDNTVRMWKMSNSSRLEPEPRTRTGND